MITKDSVCFKCGAREGSLMQRKGYIRNGKRDHNKNYIAKLLHHHVKYGEQEKIVLCCRSCHKQIHSRLRKEGKCKIPVKDIEVLSQLSKNKSRRDIIFYQTIENSLSLNETLSETRSGRILYSSSFKINNGFIYKRKLKFIDEVPKK